MVWKHTAKAREHPARGCKVHTCVGGRRRRRSADALPCWRRFLLAWRGRLATRATASVAMATFETAPPPPTSAPPAGAPPVVCAVRRAALAVTALRCLGECRAAVTSGRVAPWPAAVLLGDAGTARNHRHAALARTVVVGSRRNGLCAGASAGMRRQTDETRRAPQSLQCLAGENDCVARASPIAALTRGA